MRTARDELVGPRAALCRPPHLKGNKNRNESWQSLDYCYRVADAHKSVFFYPVSNLLLICFFFLFFFFFFLHYSISNSDTKFDCLEPGVGKVWPAGHCSARNTLHSYGPRQAGWPAGRTLPIIESS